MKMLNHQNGLVDRKSFRMSVDVSNRLIGLNSVPGTIQLYDIYEERMTASIEVIPFNYIENRGIAKFTSD